MEQLSLLDYLQTVVDPILSPILKEISRARPLAHELRAFLGSYAAAGDASDSSGVFTLNYFGLWGKGPSCALALSFSGLNWKGGTLYGGGKDPAFANWFRDKDSNLWGGLPTLSGPGCDSIEGVGTIAFENAILNYIARIRPEMGGETNADYLTSQQLLMVGEDIMILGQKYCDTPLSTKGSELTSDERDAVWYQHDPYRHNSEIGFQTFLAKLDRLYQSCSTGAGEGKYTTLGTTVGECKIFSVLHILVMAKPDVLDQGNSPGVKVFYSRFLALPETQAIVADGGKFGQPFDQYMFAQWEHAGIANGTLAEGFKGMKRA